jgi:hypothetical protein
VLAVAAVCATASSVYAQPLYEQEPAAGNQQQPPAYPPPATGDQQQGYPPPAADYAQPAPYQPPGEYAPPSTYSAGTQQPSNYSAPPPGLPDRQRGFLVMPYLGANAFLNSHRSVGVRGGGMAGLRFGRVESSSGTNYVFSTNSEFSLDWCNRTGSSSLVTKELEFQTVLAFSPLMHVILPSSNLELVMGPKVGYWVQTYSYEVANTGTGLYSTPSSHLSQSRVGFVFGLTFGAFYGMGENFALGALLNFDLRLAASCSTGSSSYSSSSGTIDTCTAGSSPRALGLNAAALF